MTDGGEGKVRVRTWPVSGDVRAAVGSARDASLWSSLVARLREWLRAEAGDGRLLPWVPIAFGIGIALYFSADREPVAWLTAIVAVVLFGIAFLLRHRKAFAATLMLAAIAGGFSVATLKTARVAHPVLVHPIYSASLQGFVETHEERERTDRFVLRVTALTAARSGCRCARAPRRRSAAMSR